MTPITLVFVCNVAQAPLLLCSGVQRHLK
uniref:Uncharacterized protein n=1 Tax=Anguilla anguilla TaxID=7936 RepID=A0A0E9SES3_ANGAN